jgi:hypothetical protein
MCKTIVGAEAVGAKAVRAEAVGAEAVGAGAASRYGSGSDQKMRLLAAPAPAPAPQHWIKYLCLTCHVDGSGTGKEEIKRHRLLSFG